MSDYDAGARVTTNALSITSYIHCGLCLKEQPSGIAPRDWAQLEIGFTSAGLQVWCRRHECNVMHIDFEGERHPADCTRRALADECFSDATEPGGNE